MLFALPLIWSMTFFETIPSSPSSRGYRFAWLAGFLFSLDLWGWHASLRYTTAANSTLLIGLAPLWVALFEWVRYQRRPHWKTGVGIVMAVSGAALLSISKGARWGLGWGEILAGIASIAYAAFMVIMNQVRESLPARRSLFHVSLSALLTLGVLGLILGESFSGFSPQAWGSLVGLGWVVQVLGWWLITWGMGHVTSSLSSLGLLIQPVATILTGWWLLHEQLTPLHALGAILILGGITVGSSVKRSPAE